MRLRPFGDRAVLVEAEGVDHVHRLSSSWREQPPPGVVEIVPGATTVLLVAAHPMDDPRLLASSPPLSGRGPAPAARPEVTIPVAYDGPDLDRVAELSGLSRGEVIRRHTDSVYRVDFIGFSPGFGYLSGGDPALAVPRLPSPRTAVPAGSVALAAGLTAVYPQPTPGGWLIIGRTDTVMFDPGRPEPALLEAGGRVRFAAVARVGPPPASPAQIPVGPPGAGQPSVEVLDPGPFLTIQDGGRAGWAHAGVPTAGALDRRSAARSNRLAGNPVGTALFEATLGACRFRLRADRTVGIAGAAADITVDGLPARPGAPLQLRAGMELAIGRARAGLRVYVAFGGGLDVAPVLGSRSTDTLSGLGPAPVRAGDVLGLGPLLTPSGGLGPVPDGTPVTGPGERVEVTARPGPRQEWLTSGAFRRLVGEDFVVASSSDRTGVRLDGPVLDRARPGELPSEGMVAGAVQVPPDGRPIVLMRNHPATGGYPVVAVVDDEGVDRLAQAPPGSRVRIRMWQSP